MKTLLRALVAAFLALGLEAYAADPQAAIRLQDYAAPVRVACIGDSITCGVGTTSLSLFAYPKLLSRMLDSKWDVRGFGASGHTLMNSGDQPYQKDNTFQKALDFKPDVVVIMLGTNDTKPQNWSFKDQFGADYKGLVDKFKALESKPRIFVCLPVPVPGKGNYGINEAGVDEEMPVIQNLAKTEGLGLIDLHTPFAGHDDYFADRVHPKNEGAFLMAKTVYNTLTGTDYTGEFNPIVTSDWSGYKRLDFVVDTRTCTLICPKEAAAGNPWIWRMEFLGAYDQVDRALLAKGYFLAYMDVSNMYGAPVAMNHLDKFYDALETDYKLAPKTVPEGFSRGGLFALNWAARHPDRIACLYLNAPVCNFTSWPGGKGRLPGSPNDWINLKKVYGFTSDEQALAYAPQPIDNLKPLVDAKIPIIGVYGDADKLLAVEDNIQLLEKRYKSMGGEIQTISKPGGDHHPHSLPDPAPIVSFILAHP